MPVVFVDGGEDAFTAMTGPRPSERVREYISNQRERFSRGLNEAGRYIQSRIEGLFKTFDYDRHDRLARRFERQREGCDIPDEIMVLDDLDLLIRAPDRMLRPIMAHPTLRRRYHRQTVAGYGDRYVDEAPGQVEHEHEEYQKVMHGVWHQPDGDSQHYCHQYADRTANSDAYEHDQVMMIRETWDEITRILEKGEIDPTSIDKASL